MEGPGRRRDYGEGLHLIGRAAFLTAEHRIIGTATLQRRLRVDAGTAKWLLSIMSEIQTTELTR